MNMHAHTRITISVVAHSLATFLAALALSACSSAPVQQRSTAVPPPTTTYQPTGSVSEYPIFLKKADGKWTAVLKGDPRKDKDTEMVYVSAKSWAYRPGAQPLNKGDSCMRKYLDRDEWGYMICNSAFYAADVGDAAAGTALRGVLSFGLLTVVEAASGITPFKVKLNQEALDKAVEESGAIAFAQQSAPLLDYRAAYRQATASSALQDFIYAYEKGFDPDGLVAEARKKLPAALERDAAAEREQNRQAELARERERRKQAAEAELGVYRANLTRGDRVMAEMTSGIQIYGLVIEVKPPLAYVQWENKSPAQEWVRLDWLRPPRGTPTTFLRRD
jgi:hypothetical protein